MRSLESLYCLSVKIKNGIFRDDKIFFIEKLCPYQKYDFLPSPKEALMIILAYMEQKNLEELIGETEIFIFPSYQFRICKGIITNFHQPHSTLILLIAALVGENWKKIYDFALKNEFRFLSYGDSSLLIP
jgi:S-adenosylmethionine:tRNA ribosyltransferase-isomerase